jgi:hypothetical protein
MSVQHSAQTVAYAACTAANVNVLLQGHPGQGKSARIKQVQEQWGRHVEVIVGSSREATDYLGVPVEVSGEVEYVPFGWTSRLNKAKKGSLVLDEFNLGSDSAIRAQLRVLQERYVGDTKLKDTVAITAIMNPPESSAGGMDLQAPVSNRFIHLAWDFDADMWMDGLLNGFENVHTPKLSDLLSPNSVQEKIRLAAMAAQFHTATGNLYLIPTPPTDPVAAGKPWASPRSWTNAINAMSFVPQNNVAARTLILNGAVGAATAQEFLTFIANNDLPNPADVIANPHAIDWDMRADKSFAITRAIASYVRMNVKADKDLWSKAAEALAVCASNGKPDVAHAALQSMMTSRPKDAILSPKVIDEFRPILGLLPNGVTQEPVAV